MRSLILALIVLASANPAPAQTPVIVTGPPQTIRLLPDQNLTQALEMVGCDAGWLSALVAENKIPVSDLGRLGYGHVYAMPAGIDCRTTAPPAVAAASRAMATTRTVSARAASLTSAVKALESEVAGLKADLAAATSSAERAVADERTCADAKAASDALVATLTGERDAARTELAARWSAATGFALGLAVSTIACLGWMAVRRMTGGAK
jgi:hypothetical protein